VLVELTSVRVDPGVDFGRADKRAVRFSYGLWGYRSWARSRCHQTLPIDQDVKGVAPGVDFAQAGKRSVRFSYASSKEIIRETARRLRISGEQGGTRRLSLQSVLKGLDARGWVNTLNVPNCSFS
jgi:hypothetical protein